MKAIDCNKAKTQVIDIPRWLYEVLATLAGMALIIGVLIGSSYLLRFLDHLHTHAARMHSPLGTIYGYALVFVTVLVMLPGIAFMIWMGIHPLKMGADAIRWMRGKRGDETDDEE